ncbi:MAG: restriction endonuclease subunit S [Cyanobium sp.]|jgi:type I restriction enzyme S subunit
MSFPRYPAYKPSGVEWLGEVPEHWEVIRLKNVLGCRITDGPHTTPEFVDEGVPFLSVDAIQDGELIFDGCRHISRENHEEYKRKAWPVRNDILMGKAASTGKIARVKMDVEFSIWSPLALIRIDGMRSSPTFYEQALKSKASQAQIDVLCTSNTQKNISMDDIPRLIMTRPPLPEQEAIATFLDRETAKIDALISEQQRLIELLQEKRQAVISHAVTKGLNPDAPMKDSGVEWLGEVPEHWDVAPLKHHWLVTDCKHVTAEFTQEGYPLASIKEVQGRWVDLDQAKRTTEAFFKLLTEGKRTPEPGDLVFSRNATVGEVAEVPVNIESFALGQDVVILKKLRITQSSSYTWSLLRSAPIINQLECAMIGSTFRRINVEQIKSLFIPVPPSQEQVSIGAHLDATSDQWAKQEQDAQQCISFLQERRSALISAAVTGQIDVRGLVPEAEAA